LSFINDIISFIKNTYKLIAKRFKYIEHNKDSIKDYKYSIELYSTAIMSSLYLYIDKHNLLNKYNYLRYVKSRHITLDNINSNVYKNSMHYNVVTSSDRYNNLKVKHISFGNYITFLKDGEDNRYIVCNTSMQDLLNFINELEHPMYKFLQNSVFETGIKITPTGVIKSEETQVLYTNKTFDTLFIEQKEKNIKYIEYI
jgi:hypothetical protein